MQECLHFAKEYAEAGNRSVQKINCAYVHQVIKSGGKLERNSGKSVNHNIIHKYFEYGHISGVFLLVLFYMQLLFKFMVFLALVLFLHTV